MKKISIFLLCLCSLQLIAQTNFQGKAIYMSKTSMDMSRFGDDMPEARKKQIIARMKNILEKTYTLNFTKSESLFKENAKLDAPGTSGPRWGASNGQGSIYKNTKDKELIEDIEQFSKRFLIVEQMEQPQWQLGTETKQIGDYICYKATMTKLDTRIDYRSIFGRRGRKSDSKKDSTTIKKEVTNQPKTIKITAWYSPQIPISTGPAEYWGLPGLILELNFDRTTILCTEITINSKNEIEIKKPTKGKKVDREEYNEIIKEKTEELKERFQNRKGGEGRGRGRF